jgi:membrane-associated phospholipid phosphatase
LQLHREGVFVAPLPFNLGLVQLLADHRNAFLTDLSLAAAFLGGASGYILLVMLVYVAWNKRLATRLAVVVLAALTFNDLLKMLLRNPRPFVAQGTYLTKWAVPAKSAHSLAMEFSTPSGHASGAAAFYSYLYARVRSRVARVIAVVMILIIGISRPYLGVHYFEDVLLGWALGLTVALLSLRYGEGFAAAWKRLNRALQVAIILPACLAIWLLIVYLNGGDTAGQPYAFLCYGGFLTGLAFARPMELKMVNFDPHSSTILVKALRYLLSIVMLALTLFLLDKGFSLFTERYTILWNLLEYLRFAAAGFVAFFLAPLLFTRIGLAERIEDGANETYG